MDYSGFNFIVYKNEEELKREFNALINDDTASKEANSTASVRQKDELAGLWCHSFEDGRISMQGYVVRPVGSDRYAVQLFSWLDGRPVHIKIFTLEELSQWHFYSDSKTMRYAHHLELVRHNEAEMDDWEWNERAAAFFAGINPDEEVEVRHG